MANSYLAVLLAVMQPLKSSDDEIFKVFDRGAWKKAKKCIYCNKVFTDRKKYNDFAQVKYCSKNCKYKSKLT